MSPEPGLPPSTSSSAPSTSSSACERRSDVRKPVPAVPVPAVPAAADWTEIVASQDGVISVRGALAAGLTWSEIRWKLASGRWQRPMHDVVVTHSGTLTYPQWLWCVTESIGPPVYLAGSTAARLGGLKGFSSESDAVDVVVPASRRPSPRPGSQDST